MTEFPVVPSRTAVLFFDTYNSSLHPENPDPERRALNERIIPTLVRLNQLCRQAGISVFYTQPEHRADHRDVAPLIVGMDEQGRVGRPRVLARRNTVAGSWGAEIIPEIAPQPGDYVIAKHRWSTFFQTHFELSLRTAGIDTIILAGGATHVGVASTAYSARDHDYNLIVVRDACYAAKPGIDEFFMERIFPVFARVMTVEELGGIIQTPTGSG